jgi:hypothetical protein
MPSPLLLESQAPSVAELSRAGEGIRVLFLASSAEDYLADSLLHGLRTLLGSRVVDFPKADRLYRNYPDSERSQLRGHGFSLYGLLDDIHVDRHNVYDKIQGGAYDLIVLGNLPRDFGLFLQLLPVLDPKDTALLDGADGEQPYPYAGRWWRRPRFWFLPRANRFLCFKRELTPATLHYRLFRLAPKSICKALPLPANWRPTAFSIPAEKVAPIAPAKSKTFTTHIVDPEAAARIPGAQTQYAFQDEGDYYDDIRRSRFGITMKRAGWDCLRHYELAANGCVPCFRNLDKKPASCAPHGLSQDNCVVYQDFDNLNRQLSNLSEEQYRQLQNRAIQWARQNTTVERAKQLRGCFQGLPVRRE